MTPTEIFIAGITGVIIDRFIERKLRRMGRAEWIPVSKIIETVIGAILVGIYHFAR